MTISHDGIELEIEYSLPQNRRVPVLVLAHPHPKMGGDMHNKVIDQIYRRSKEQGWGVVRFNFRGVGKSTGEYDQGAGEVNDLLGVLQWAGREFDLATEEFSIVGYSFGSWIAAKATATLPKLHQVVLIAPPVTTFDFSMFFGVKHPKFVFAAERDEIVPLQELETWFKRLDPPKSLQVIPEADHFFVGETTGLVRAVLRALKD